MSPSARGRYRIEIRIEGLEEWRQVFRRAPRRAQQEVEHAMKGAVRVMEAEIVPRAPIDRGRLRQSIHPVVYRQPGRVVGMLATKLHYAPYQEYGTGLLAEAPGGKGRRHYPPPSALELWARRHGWESGEAIAWAIYKNGGVKPKRFFREGFQAAAPKAQSLFDSALDRMINLLR